MMLLIDHSNPPLSVF